MNKAQLFVVGKALEGHSITLERPKWDMLTFYGKGNMNDIVRNRSNISATDTTGIAALNVKGCTCIPSLGLGMADMTVMNYVENFSLMNILIPINNMF
ncbi:hypothetical protein ACJMK2_003888 [Sinanodonta woodiana]|uniref:Uncharacterized protein n=1 Tax=Sinanodonta woodiana TaxID=1069815 RepID=A0ABD3XZJ9_SINWO